MAHVLLALTGVVTVVGFVGVIGALVSLAKSPYKG
jgi:hypothetical protein